MDLAKIAAGAWGFSGSKFAPNDTKVKAICLECGQEYEKLKLYTFQIYCSKKCGMKKVNRDWRARGTVEECLYCGGPAIRDQSNVGRFNASRAISCKGCRDIVTLTRKQLGVSRQRVHARIQDEYSTGCFPSRLDVVLSLRRLKADQAGDA